MMLLINKHTYHHCMQHHHCNNNNNTSVMYVELSSAVENRQLLLPSKLQKPLKAEVARQ